MYEELFFTYHNAEGRTISPRVASYTKELRAVVANPDRSYPTPLHVLNLPSDTQLQEEVRRVAKLYWTNQLRYVVVVGIGGPNLGGRAVMEALRGAYDAQGDTYPKVFFVDTTSPRSLDELLGVLKKNVHHTDEILINLISKSGTTTESLVNFEYLFAGLIKQLPKLRERVVVTTDRGSPLWASAEKNDFGLLAVPREIGGRFSVFSPVGLFPFALLNVDIEALTKGAADCIESVFNKENSALRAAEVLFRARLDGASILNFFFFNPELEGVGKWCRQLYAESLGKEKDRSGKTVRAGFTPIVSIGSTDLHSMAQLYFGGPRDKFTFFLHVPRGSSQKVSRGVFGGIVPGIEGRSPEEVIAAIYRGVKVAYDKHKLPYGEVRIPGISPYGLGTYLAWHMMVVMYLGELMNVNVFDQPSVEDYKRATREILEHGK